MTNTTPDESEPRSNINEEVLHIPQRFTTGVWPLNGLVPYPRHLLLEAIPA